MIGPGARLTDPISHDQMIPCGTIGAPLVPPPLAALPVLTEGKPAAYVTCTAVCTGATAAGPAHPPVPPAGAGGGGVAPGAGESADESAATEAEPGKKTFELRLISGGLLGVSVGGLCGPEARADAITYEIRDPATGERAAYVLDATNVGLTCGTPVSGEFRYDGEPVRFSASDGLGVRDFSSRVVQGNAGISQVPHVDVGDDIGDYLPDFAKDVLKELPDVDVPVFDFPQPKAGDLLPGLGWANYVGRFADANPLGIAGLVLIPDKFWEGPIFIVPGGSESVALGTLAEAAVGTGRLTYVVDLPPLEDLPPVEEGGENGGSPPVPPAPVSITPFVSGSSNVFIHGLPALRWVPTDVAGCGVTPGFPSLLPLRSVFIGG